MTQATSLVFLALVHVAAADVAGDACAVGSTVMAGYDINSNHNYGDGPPKKDVYEAVITSVAPDGNIGVTFLTGETGVSVNRNNVFGLTKEGCKQQWKTNPCNLSPGSPDLVWALYYYTGDDAGPSHYDYWYEADILSQSDAVSYNIHWDTESEGSQQETHTRIMQKCVGSSDQAYESCFPCVDHCSCSEMFGLSGDPVVHIGGYTVKFELPMHTQTLLWDDHGFEIFGQADLVTPDKKSQWFSEFMLVHSGRKVATIQRKAIDAAGKERPGALNTLSLTIYDEEARPMVITAPGSYSIGNGSNRTGQVLVKRKDAKLGPMRKEEVFVKSNALSFSIAAEMAKKFGSRRVALKYTHLDIQLLKTSSDVTRGIFAELFGFIPMSSKTAKMIRSMTS